MELWRASALVLGVLALACSARGLSLTLDGERWASDEGQDAPPEGTLAGEVARLLKRSKSHQFYGLMGKRSESVKPVKMERRPVAPDCHQRTPRHKGGVFVGLMGKRSFGAAQTQESSPAPDQPTHLNTPRGLQNDWDRLQYY